MTKKITEEIKCLSLTTGLYIRSDGVNHICCAADLDRDYLLSHRIYSHERDLTSLFESNQKVTEMSSALSKGIFPIECRGCEKREAQGIRSQRQRIEEKWGNKEESPGLRFINLELGNLCNFKCVYCGPIYSTKWNEDLDIQEKYGITQEHLPHNDWTKSEELWKYLVQRIKESPQFETLEIVGGEPFLSPAHNHLLKLLISEGLASRVELLYSTNLSLLSDEQIELLNQFKNVEVLLSLDSIDPKKFHYIRYPGNLEKVLSNFSRLKKERPVTRIFITVHALNTLELPSLLSWCQEQGIRPAFNVVMFPKFMHPKSLPLHLREEIIEKIKDFRFSRKEQLITQLEMPFDSEMNELLRSYLSDLDIKRNTNARILFTEVFL